MARSCRYLAAEEPPIQRTPGAVVLIRVPKNSGYLDGLHFLALAPLLIAGSRVVLSRLPRPFVEQRITRIAKPIENGRTNPIPHIVIVAWNDRQRDPELQFELFC